MSSTPILSVVVPFYGVEDYLLECLESIQSQTLRDMQVVLVDDGSPDNSIEIAERVAANDARFQVIRQKNAGLGPARNTGFEHAVGTYLTFVDSDDIVPHRAFQSMVDSLERTGSSFAVGNARRFSRTSGVRQSWAHARPCARDAVATHILERPVLAYDRMVWNKVYRRDFYTDHAYAFPPIKYEDWPVTMRAHLDALTVDVLKTPTYYWRERESGDSITQQVFKYDNLLDRVVSAEMVFDVLDRQASSAVRSMAHRHLMEIDMVAVAQAFAVAHDDDVERLLALSKRFVDRLEPPHAGETRYNQLQYHALRSGDADLLRDLARFRDEGGLVGGTTVSRNRVKPWRWTLNYPGRKNAATPSKLYELPFTSLTLRSLVTSVRWVDGVSDAHGAREDHAAHDALEIEATAEIGHLEATDGDAVTVSLVNGIERVPLDVETFHTIDASRHRGPVGLRFRVEREQIASLGATVWPLRFEVSRTTAGVRRTTMLTGAGAGSPQFPRGRFLTREQYMQPGLTAGNVYCLHRVAFPTVLTDVTADDSSLTLRGSLSDPARKVSIVVFRPGGEVEFRATVSEGEDGFAHFEASLDAAAVLAGDSPDDPFLHSATRRLALRTEFGDFDLTWVDHAGDVITRQDDVAVAITRSRFGNATLISGPVLPSVRRVSEADGVLTLRGEHLGLPVVDHLVWRKYLPGSDDHVDLPVEVTRQGTDFVATTTLVDLVPTEDLPTQPGAPAADYTLFFVDEEHENPVAAQPAAIADLPIEHLTGGRTILATSVAGGTRVQVR